ncbi:hypothetical protein G7054_g6371 [Neopestalotiopsis clavispora]|nr:hypothetical protein G7054_g6371 [Neopestalotiopsis clavispora]
MRELGVQVAYVMLDIVTIIDQVDKPIAPGAVDAIIAVGNGGVAHLAGVEVVALGPGLGPVPHGGQAVGPEPPFVVNGRVGAAVERQDGDGRTAGFARYLDRRRVGARLLRGQLADVRRVARQAADEAAALRLARGVDAGRVDAQLLLEGVEHGRREAIVVGFVAWCPLPGCVFWAVGITLGNMIESEDGKYSS